MTTAEMKQELDKLNERVKQLEAEIEKAESEPEFEIARGESYYFIDFCEGYSLSVKSDTYVGGLDKVRVDHNNCFHTKERAQEVCDKIKFLLEAERLRDIFCPGYYPNWEEDNNTYRYYVYYDNANGVYCAGRGVNAIHPSTVYFPTLEIAQKASHLLNRGITWK